MYNDAADFGDLAAEEQALAEAAGLVDRSDTDIVLVTGSDRIAFLQGMVTNDLKRLTAGQGCEAAWLNVKARVQMLMTVLVDADSLLFGLPGGHAGGFMAAIDRFVITEDVVLEDLSASGAVLGIEGPHATDIVAELVDAQSMPDEAPLSHREGAVAGRPVRLVRRSESPGGGIELWLERDHAAAVWDACVAAGLPPCGQSAREVARIAAGRARFGVDVTSETFLPDVPHDHLVSWKKGCYLGQEPVARVHFRGRANRGLVGLRVRDGAPTPEVGASLHHAGREVGHVTSAAWSAYLGVAIALAVARREVFEPGTELAVASPDGPIDARVAAWPLWPAERSETPQESP